MSRRLLVNDAMSQLGERTFWHLLKEWFDMEFVGGDYASLAERAKDAAKDASLIIRNATWFPPIETKVPTISLLQDIIPEGLQRAMQEEIISGSAAVVFNSAFTQSKYPTGMVMGMRAIDAPPDVRYRVVPLPVDFSVFEPQNAMGCQQALSLPEGCVCWIGASQGAAGNVKGWDVLLQIARLNPDLHFVCVFKDAIPASFPPNMRCYARLKQEELVKVIGACRVGLCTSRTESQHLAGIEMGACGLPLVVPPVGCYWKRAGDLPIYVVEDGDFTKAIRVVLAAGSPPGDITIKWRAEFDIPVVRAAWEKLVEEIECSGQS